MNVVNLIQQSMITGKRTFISPRKLYLSRFVLKTLKDVKLHSLLDDLMYEVYESEKKDDLFKVKPLLEELLLDYVSEKNEYIETFCEHFIDILNVEKSNKRLGFTDFPETYWRLYPLVDPKDVSKHRTVLQYDI